jgi:hypothetical protein
MKNILTNTVLFIALCGVLNSCKKRDNEELVTFPLELAYNNLSIKNHVRLFTNGQEIKDTAIIYNFLSEDKNLFTTTNWVGVDMGELKFTSADTLEFSVQDNKGKLPFFLILAPWELTYRTVITTQEVVTNIKYSVLKINNEIYFYSLKPVLALTNDFGYKLLKYIAPSEPNSSPSLPSPGMPIEQRITRKMLVGYGNYTEINMSYFIFKYTHHTHPSYKIRGNISNEFNESIISTLAAKDTLAVTTFSINYKKR